MYYKIEEYFIHIEDFIEELEEKNKKLQLSWRIYQKITKACPGAGKSEEINSLKAKNIELENQLNSMNEEFIKLAKFLYKGKQA